MTSCLRNDFRERPSFDLLLAEFLDLKEFGNTSGKLKEYTH